MDESPRVVLDANLIVRGLLTPYGSSGRALRALAEGLFVFVTSESILYEVATILSEPRVQRYGPFPPDEMFRHQALAMLKADGFTDDEIVNAAAVKTDTSGGNRRIRKLTDSGLSDSPSCRPTSPGFDSVCGTPSFIELTR